MRAVLEDMKSGEVMTCNVPAPELRPLGILVRTHFSAISSGTERAKVQMGEQSLLQKARSRPELVKQVLDYARTNGVRAAYQKVQAHRTGDRSGPCGSRCCDGGTPRHRRW